MAAFSGWVRVAHRRKEPALDRFAFHPLVYQQQLAVEFESSWVRSATRASRCSFASPQHLPAALNGVISVKVMTKPPQAWGCPASR